LRSFLHLILALAAALTLASCERPPVNRNGAIPLSIVAHVDLDRYLGRWYEIARFPNAFERDCVGVTATYSRNDDGTIKVINRCRKGTLDGAEDVAEGVASVVDAQSNAKLTVTFFWPFAGDYWIIGLADDYSWALVGEPSGHYLWILSRSPRIDSATRAEVIRLLRAQRYNTDALYWTPQPP